MHNVILWGFAYTLAPIMDPLSTSETNSEAPDTNGEANRLPGPPTLPPAALAQLDLDQGGQGVHFMADFAMGPNMSAPGANNNYAPAMVS